MIIKPKRNQIKIIWIVKRIKIPINQRSLWLELLDKFPAFIPLYSFNTTVWNCSRGSWWIQVVNDPCFLFCATIHFSSFLIPYERQQLQVKSQKKTNFIPVHWHCIHIFDHHLIFFCCCFIFAFTDECIFRARFTKCFNFFGRFVFSSFSHFSIKIYKYVRRVRAPNKVYKKKVRNFWSFWYYYDSSGVHVKDVFNIFIHQIEFDA